MQRDPQAFSLAQTETSVFEMSLEINIENKAKTYFGLCSSKIIPSSKLFDSSPRRIRKQQPRQDPPEATTHVNINSGIVGSKIFTSAAFFELKYIMYL